MSRRKLIFVHHFSLSKITGVTVMLSELLKVLPLEDPEIQVAYESFDQFGSAGDLSDRFDAEHLDVNCIVAVNLQIDAQWEFSLALMKWCETRAVPLHIYIHDYWPHHRGNLLQLIAQNGTNVLASTPFIIDTLHKDGFDAALVPVGVPGLEEGRAPESCRAVNNLIASVGRLVPRKRFADIVRAFCHARLDDWGRLYLRLLPSLVFGLDDDDKELHRIQTEIVRGGVHSESIQIDRLPTAVHDYTGYSIYVSASEYEGYGMTVVEAAYSGCPPIISAIPAHCSIANALFTDYADKFLYPVGDHEALAAVLRDEVATAQRRTFLLTHLDDIRANIRSRYSLRTTARSVAALCQAPGGVSQDQGGSMRRTR